jgi:outer membrane lipoprotein-sorting protein
MKKPIMKKNIFTFLFFFLSGLLSFAQSSEEARKILDRFYESYEQSRGVTFSFEVTTIDANGMRYHPQQGEAMMKGDKFKLDLNTAIIWFDGKTQWVLLKDAGEVNISTPSAKELAFISPLALLRLYKSGYTLKKPVSAIVNGQSAYVIEMIPTTSYSDFKQLENPVLSTSIKDENDEIEYITDPELIHEKWENFADIVIDGGYGGIEPSTVVDCTTDEPKIIRQGKGILIL